MPVKGPFVRVHMDYCGPFPVIKRLNQYILLAICPMTNYIILKAVPAATAQAAAQFILNSVVLTHGCFEELVTDRGKHFMGNALQDVLKVLGVKHLMTSAYHPQTDGNAERSFHTLNNMLSDYVSDHHKDWNGLLHLMAWAMNTSHHSN